MTPPLDALVLVARLKDPELGEAVDLAGRRMSRQFVLYDLLRHEQALAAAADGRGRTEVSRILDLAQMAYGELVGFLVGRPDHLLDEARDGEWTLRDLLRHAIAVEVRYAAQVEWAASRMDEAPLAIPDARLPCDRLSPPEPDFADSRSGSMLRLLGLFGEARARSDAVLADIPDETLGRASLWGQLEMPVRMRLHQIAAHLTEVLVQSEKMLASEGGGGEAQRILGHCCAVRGSHERWSDAAARVSLDARYEDLARSIMAGTM